MKNNNYEKTRSIFQLIREKKWKVLLHIFYIGRNFNHPFLPPKTSITLMLRSCNHPLLTPEILTSIIPLHNFTVHIPTNLNQIMQKKKRWACQEAHSTSTPPRLDLPKSLEGGDGEHSNGSVGSSISPFIILTISPASGLNSGIFCKHIRARLMHKLASSLSNSPFNLSSTSSRTLPLWAKVLHQLTKLACSSFMGEARTWSGLLPETMTRINTPKL